MSVDPLGTAVAGVVIHDLLHHTQRQDDGELDRCHPVLSLGSGPVGISTTRAYETVATLRNRLDVARRREEAFLRDRFGEGRMGEGMAVKAAAMWTTISTPGENGGGM